jgi:hypothetical protein
LQSKSRSLTPASRQVVQIVRFSVFYALGTLDAASLPVVASNRRHAGDHDMFRHPLARDIAWVSIAKLVVLALIYVLFFTPSQHGRADLFGHIAGVVSPGTAAAR